MADVASAIVKRSTRGRLAYEDGHKRRHRRSLLALRRCQRISQMRPALLRYCSPLQCLALAVAGGQGGDARRREGLERRRADEGGVEAVAEEGEAMSAR